MQPFCFSCDVEYTLTMKMKLSLISAAILSTSLLLSPAASFAKLPVAVNGQQLPTLAPMLEQITLYCASPKVVAQLAKTSDDGVALQALQVQEWFLRGMLSTR